MRLLVKKWLNQRVLGLIGWYRAFRSLRPDACRYSPTCTAFLAEAVEVHGTGRGLFLGIRRVSRCHPWGGHGYDPVPPIHHLSPHDCAQPEVIHRHA